MPISDLSFEKEVTKVLQSRFYQSRSILKTHAALNRHQGLKP